MKSQDVNSTALGSQIDPQTAPLLRQTGEGTFETAEEANLNELADYVAVPPRRAVSISIQYRKLGRGRPLPYILDEDGAE
jgi:hypothetical protein